ncbi:putative dynamin GTPase [Helianthus annuus]|nr:putative dynamin GTPase [Helianthus annuus]
MEAVEELTQLADSMRQAAALLNDEDVDENSSNSTKRSSTFLNVVALGNTVNVIESCICPVITVYCIKSVVRRYYLQ